MKCPVCGSVLPNYCTFCSVCGAPLVEEAPSDAHGAARAATNTEDPLLPADRAARQSRGGTARKQRPPSYPPPQ